MNTASNPQYIPEYLLPEGEEKEWGIVFSERKILLKKAESGYQIPTKIELQGVADELGTGEYFGKYERHNCFYIRINKIPAVPSELEFVDIMQISSLTGDPGLFLLAGTANHIAHWNHMNQFCGRCGHQTVNKADERAKICPACGNVVYPRISPATITAVFRGNEILLAHNRNFKGNMHGLIAGFVEPGETLEQCAAREIREETGIEVKNIRYFSSQPWPFPDSLMVAFLADYESGEISVDGEEITKAAWFNADHLPEIPSADSIAGKLIRWYRDRRS